MTKQSMGMALALALLAGSSHAATGTGATAQQCGNAIDAVTARIPKVAELQMSKAEMRQAMKRVTAAQQAVESAREARDVSPQTCLALVQAADNLLREGGLADAQPTKDRAAVGTEGQTGKPRLGVQVQPLSGALADAFGIEAGTGVLVTSVMEDSVASRAGLQSGDVITRFGGETIRGPGDLQRAVRDAPAGEELTVSVTRGGEFHDKKVALQAAAQPRPAADRAAEEGADQPKLGLTVTKLTPQMAEQFGVRGVDRGVVVAEVHSGTAAADAGLQHGDVIVTANLRPVTSPLDLVTGVRKAAEAGRDHVALYVYRDGSYNYVAVPLS